MFSVATLVLRGIKRKCNTIADAVVPVPDVCKHVADSTTKGGVTDVGIQASGVSEPKAVAIDTVAPKTEAPLDKFDILRRRREVSSKAQSVSYENTSPLLIVKGRGQYLIDEAGVQYLDTRNNVCHVGHCNKRVADAVAQQVHTLNTNTRYLHPKHVELSEKLLATFPAPLSQGKVFFVNSGSEANDLAIRLARAHTRHESTIVVERAYHGHTCDVIGISPYKYKHGIPSIPRSQKPDWVTEVPAPDVYRGEHRGKDAASRYAEYVENAVQKAVYKEGGMSAFFIESGMSIAGVIVPPKGYLAMCYKAVRDAGGVCVADEVQVGFGRFGKHFWAFEESDVVPDIVTVGKPFGNGMPLAAVVCRREISDSFAEGPEYFNTFGGNPVVCAAGLAVLQELDDGNLQKQAIRVGAYLRESLRRVMEGPNGHWIGDVRGIGMFTGIEFVKNQSDRIPATVETSWLCSRLKDVHHILTSIDGPHHNVLVLKPPLVFDEENVDTFIQAMDEELGSMDTIDTSAIAHTPT